jgi:hypothetical protein
MIISKQINHLLEKYCVAVIPPLYDNETLTLWNKVFTDILAKQDKTRKYVTTADFIKNNLLLDIFSPKLQSLIYNIMPTAELYHCHVYEIEKKQSKSHIMGDDPLKGWHRDSDCKHDYNKAKVQHISLFVYLSDVKKDDGCFEVSTKKIHFPPVFGNSDKNFKLIGNTGTTFLFDRKAFHRASPNLGNNPRRVLKLSFQSKHIYNHKRLLPDFKVVRDYLKPTDIFLRQLFGDKTLTDKEFAISSKTLTDEITNSDTLANAILPDISYSASFTLTQNFRRYIRDCLFITRRLVRKLIPSLDSVPPKRAISQLIKDDL